MEDSTPKKGHGRVHFKRPESVGYSDLVPAKRLGRLASFGVDASLIFSILMIGVIFSFSLPLALAFITAYIVMRDMARGVGRSLGRSMASQRLLNEDGSEASPGKVIGRSVVRLLLWMTVLPFFIDLFMVVAGNGRTISDYIFDTRVFMDPDVVKSERALRKPAEQRSAAVAASSEEDELLREAAADIQFESHDYNRRQLDDFESRLSGSVSASDTKGNEDQDIDLLSDFEARLNAATSSPSTAEAPFEPLELDPELFGDTTPASVAEEIAVPQEEKVSVDS